ncbi:hypothetical protein VFPPC_17402 [Pochonia chlamydosporia 170]|uniref:Uncharacterized protein n=1 Tax=Pochonia chlamydosporia 170 TaxID=1380566 RepID=A0A219AS79_METCM|nr:hypothetical protein VFPPC_17402 [Pochonia chlamydosporia 170]OWT43449.1 hypothetical protein VFPPC_17402 [Pochonia chlamydosporia 170]
MPRRLSTWELRNMLLAVCQGMLIAQKSSTKTWQLISPRNERKGRAFLCHEAPRWEGARQQNPGHTRPVQKNRTKRRGAAIRTIGNGKDTFDSNLPMNLSCNQLICHQCHGEPRAGNRPGRLVEAGLVIQATATWFAFGHHEL